jgi:hypothetical protein
MRKDDWSIFWKPHAVLTAVALLTLLPFWLGWLPLRLLDGLVVLNIQNCPSPVPNGVNGLSQLFADVSVLLTTVIGLVMMFWLGPSIYRFRSKPGIGSMSIAGLICTALAIFKLSGLFYDPFPCKRATATISVFIELFWRDALGGHLCLLMGLFAWLQVASKLRNAWCSKS